MNKKKVFALALAVCMIATLSLSSLAWFSDSDDVTNNFYIASSDDTDPDDIFSVDVWENTPGGDKDQDGYEYKDILPGDVLKKEVYVENTGYYDQYVRVTVTVSDAGAWGNALNKNAGETPKLWEIVNGWDNADTWGNCTSAVVDNEIVYTMYYRNVLLGEQTNDRDPDAANVSEVKVFDSVKIPASMTVEQAAAFQNNFKITVKAEAVQTENVGNSAMDAFATVANNG